MSNGVAKTPDLIFFAAADQGPTFETGQVGKRVTIGTLNGIPDVPLPIWRDPAAWAKTADVFATLIALALPWSTSLVAIFVVAWLVTVAPTLEIKPFLQSLKRPMCALPIALFTLAAVGTLWSDASWGERLYTHYSLSNRAFDLLTFPYQPILI